MLWIVHLHLNTNCVIKGHVKERVSVGCMYDLLLHYDDLMSNRCKKQTNTTLWNIRLSRCVNFISVINIVQCRSPGPAFSILGCSTNSTMLKNCIVCVIKYKLRIARTFEMMFHQMLESALYWTLQTCARYQRYAMHRSEKFQAPPNAVDFLWSCEGL